MEEILERFYNIDECKNREKLVKELDKLKDEGKIEYNINMDILEIIDLDLEEKDIKKLVKLFDMLDIFPEEDSHIGDDDDLLWDDFDE